tara:strand:- start:3715 stop:4206 length:492 start_codon:yes stop_codon:yes gene_type:complete
MPIDTRLTYDDIKWLIAAADAWEEKESHEFFFAKEILSIPDFDEDHPAYEFIQHFKQKYRGQEQTLADKKDGVSEKASTMKAKLFYLKRALGMAGLLDVEEGTVVDGEGNSQEMPNQEPPKKPHPLQAKLAEAIRDEDYDKAARIRDEIRELENSEKSGDSEE